MPKGKVEVPEGLLKSIEESVASLECAKNIQPQIIRSIIQQVFDEGTFNEARLLELLTTASKTAPKKIENYEGKPKCNDHNGKNFKHKKNYSINNENLNKKNITKVFYPSRLEDRGTIKHKEPIKWCSVFPNVSPKVINRYENVAPWILHTMKNCLQYPEKAYTQWFDYFATTMYRVGKKECAKNSSDLYGFIVGIKYSNQELFSTRKVLVNKSKNLLEKLEVTTQTIIAK